MLYNQRWLSCVLLVALAAGCSSNDNDSKPARPDPVPGSSGSGASSSTSSTSSSSSSSGIIDKPDHITCNGDTCVIEGSFTADFTMTADIQWVLNGLVAVGSGNSSIADLAAVDEVRARGVTLTIEPGTHIRANNNATLLVTRGSKIMAEGTAAEPITFSSAQDEDFDGEGEWGGIVVQGFAPQYGAGDTGACYGSGTVCNVAGEGGDGIGFFGGNDPADNSGVMKYIRIAEGGLIAGPNNEINGLTLQGVGHGTQLEYIQVHGNQDDGIEWFGGAVNLKYAVLSNNDDDDLDFDEGYRGNIQHVIVRKNPFNTAPIGTNDPRGIEGNSSSPDQVRETEAAIANLTIIGSDLVVTGIAESGVRLRGDVQASIWNSVVTGFSNCVRVDSGTIVFTNVVLGCADGSIDDRSNGGLTANNIAEIAMDEISLDSLAALQNEQGLLSAQTEIAPVDNGSAFTFDQTDYVGAVDPRAENSERDWWSGWTLPGSLNLVTEPAEADFVNCSEESCTLSGMISEDYTLTRGTQWILSGFTTVGSGHIQLDDAGAVQAIKDAGVTLTIESGVHVRATNDAVLLVTRGSQLRAIGSRRSPITFSSIVDEDFDGEGEWGGVVIQGFAPQYGAGDTGVCSGAGTVCNVAGEGGDQIGFFGGDDPADDSGELRYVRIAEGGLVAGPNNEINGLTLQGVGHATRLSYIQVHNNLDDSIEWFGGTANLTHAVLTNNDDDDIDFDEGYQGNMQYLLIRKNPGKAAPTGSNDPRAVEANSSSPDQVSDTRAVIANMTIVGSDLVVSGSPQPALRLRGDVSVSVWNSAVSGFSDCYRIDSGTNAFTNFLGSCVNGFADDQTAGSGVTTSNTVDVPGGSLEFNEFWALSQTEAILASPTNITAVNNGSGFAFEATSFIGAVDPASDDPWWSGWTIPGSVTANAD